LCAHLGVPVSIWGPIWTSVEHGRSVTVPARKAAPAGESPPNRGLTEMEVSAMTNLPTQPGRAARRAQAVRELGQLARRLYALDMAADRASARGDADTLADICEELLVLHVAFAECYRRLLVIGVRDVRHLEALAGTDPDGAA